SLIHLRGGVVLVTGPTGSGKTSTLASLIDLINTQYRKHIITLEDPIEYLQPSKKSVVHQRGLHYDITDFPSGLKAALREDPDIILIGEMRDLETIRLALTAAEVGSLVFGTLHTNGAVQSVDRIIDVFPADEQPQIRAMLSQSLQGVVSQVLLKNVQTGGRIPATEVMFGSPAVSNLIREAKIQDIVSIIQAGKQQGMHTMDDSLVQLVTKKLVDPEEAYSYAENKGWFEQFVDMPLLKK
ncbi:MAG TPA: PilT/PilU family type 4a pilus ATPase, partial [bacterium]|nr:PilT/PilU family type 4a pilus ATPase [bacterium]